MMKKDFIQKIIICFCLFYVFQNTFDIGFDFEVALKYIQPLHIKTFDHKPIEYIMNDFQERGHFYRPVKNIFLYFAYHLWGLDFRPYKAVVLIVHLFSALFLMGYLRNRDIPGRLIFPTFILFLIWHPSLRPVMFINNSEDVFHGMFMLAALCCYRFGRRVQKRVYLLLSTLSFTLALSSKESALILPFLIGLDELYTCRTSSPGDGIVRNFKILQQVAVRMIPFLAIVGFYWSVRLLFWSPFIGYTRDGVNLHARAGFFMWTHLADNILTVLGYCPEIVSGTVKIFIAAVPFIIFCLVRDRSIRLAIGLFAVSLLPFLSLAATPHRLYFSSAMVCYILIFGLMYCVDLMRRRPMLARLFLLLLLVSESAVAHRYIKRYYSNIIQKTSMSFGLAEKMKTSGAGQNMYVLTDPPPNADSGRRQIRMQLEELKRSHMDILNEMYFPGGCPYEVLDTASVSEVDSGELRNSRIYRLRKGHLDEIDPLRIDSDSNESRSSLADILSVAKAAENRIQDSVFDSVAAGLKTGIDIFSGSKGPGRPIASNFSSMLELAESGSGLTPSGTGREITRKPAPARPDLTQYDIPPRARALDRNPPRYRKPPVHHETVIWVDHAPHIITRILLKSGELMLAIQNHEDCSEQVHELVDLFYSFPD